MEQNNKDQELQQQPSQKKNKQPKLSAFGLVQMFKQNILIKRCNGTRYYYDQQKCYFVPLSKENLESILLNMYYPFIAPTDSIRVVKTAADIIMRLDCPEMVSHQWKNYLGFKNGYLDFNTPECLTIFPHHAPHLDMRYIIQSDGFTIGDTWDSIKHLKTEWMDYFLSCIAGNDQALIVRIWQMIGYLLTPDTDGKCFFLLQGVPNSGKTILGNFLSCLFPAEKISNLDIDQLGKRHATSLLVDKQINISMDLPNKSLSPLAIRSIKLMTGNDDLTVEYGNGTYATYHGGCKFLFATNHALTLRGIDEGFTDRIVCIPFQHAIEIEKRDPQLLQHLLVEANNIVCKAISYYRDLRYNNYRFSGDYNPQIMYLPTEADDADANLCQFVEERCCFVSKQHHKTHTSDLYDNYLDFCFEHKYTPIGSIVAFSRRLHTCYGDKLKKDKWRKENSSSDTPSQNGFCGIILNTEHPDIIAFDI